MPGRVCVSACKVTVFVTAFPGLTRESKWETPVWVEMQEGNALFTIWERLQITGYGNPFWACNFRRGKVFGVARRCMAVQ